MIWCLSLVLCLSHNSKVIQAISQMLNEKIGVFICLNSSKPSQRLSLLCHSPPTHTHNSGT